eukprot:1703071-Prymnesium_polylepis.1
MCSPAVSAHPPPPPAARLTTRCNALTSPSSPPPSIQSCRSESGTMSANGTMASPDRRSAKVWSDPFSRIESELTRARKEASSQTIAIMLSVVVVKGRQPA